MLFSPNQMHIPDGFLSGIVSIVLWLVSIAVLAIALRKTNKTLGDREIPLMGVLAAAIFAGQMLNFSITGGTSGHLLGAALATILLGPWSAVLVLTSVVAIQALIFQDGGLLALGANIFNMAIVGVFSANLVYTLIRKVSMGKSWSILVGGFVAAWTSIFIASLAAALELSISGTSPANLSIPAMGGIHALIGIGEGLITTGALAFIYASRRDLFTPEKAEAGTGKLVLIAGGILTLILAILSPLASSHPDGLEWVAEQQGFIEKAQEAVYNLIPDYTFPGIDNPTLSTIIAGVIGAILVFGVAFTVAKLQKKQAAN
ncbi:MAG TPA: energy-coupling factor ABC transporter permease [Anaerolineaceae bacterium]